MFSGPWWAASRMPPLLEPHATGRHLLLGGREDSVSLGMSQLSTDLGRQRSWETGEKEFSHPKTMVSVGTADGGVMEGGGRAPKGEGG